jgi:hypothetical protein
MTGIKDQRMVIELCEGDFERSMGRKPRGQEEFEEWARLAQKGLMNGPIDWDILHECTCDALLRGGERR